MDYHEFRHCLESAAGALASAGARPNVCIPIVIYIALLLATYTIMKSQQRKLLYEWLQFLIVDLVIGALLLLVICSRELIVIMFDAFTSPQWRNNYVAQFRLKLLETLKMTDLGNRNTDNNNGNDDDDNGDDHESVTIVTTIHATAVQPMRDNSFDFLLARIDHAKATVYQLSRYCAKLFNSSNSCHGFRLHAHVAENTEQKTMMILSMPQITTDTTTTTTTTATHTTTNHQIYFNKASSFNCKSCQTKLLTTVDSLNQTHRPKKSSTRYNVCV